MVLFLKFSEIILLLVQKLLLRMLDKKSERRISLKQICLCQWFTSHYKSTRQITFRGSTKDEDFYASNTFTELKPHESITKANKQKYSEEEENFNFEEGKINMNNYNINPKFLKYDSFKCISYENHGSPGINNCSITKNMTKKSFCFLGVTNIIIKLNLFIF